MNATIRGLKGLISLAALAGVGLGLRWTTAGSVGSASTQDLTSMAVLTVGAVAWVAYTWLLIAVLATVLEQVPGAIGHAASAVAGRITSQTSRTLLRSALGVAAVTPLTIGVAQATPTTVPTANWAPFESPSTVRLTSPTNWHTPEPPSTLPLTNTPTTHPTHRPTARSTQHPIADPARLTQRPIANPAHPTQPPRAEPAAAADPNQHLAVPARPLGRPAVPESPADFRATEKTSTLRLTDASAAHPDQHPADTSEAQTGQRPNAQPAPAADLGQRLAVPVKPPAHSSVPESPADFRTSEKASTVDLSAAAGPDRPKAGRVGVPDRPTEGAPTRYTDLRSGHPLRTATRVVQHGDTLWGLAAAELGPDATDSAIAARWPQWYATNRALIGPDPDLLYPGQVLRIPAPTHPVPPTHKEK